MASLLKLALEGQLGGMLGYLDTSNGQQHTGSWLTHGQNTGGRGPEAIEQGQRDLIELKGPLAIQLQEALAKMYDKHAIDRTNDESEKEAEVATESQANDALMQQELVDNIRIMTEGEESDNSTTIYGVDAKDVKPEDIVEVSQATDGEKANDFVVVMAADQDGDAKPELDALATALESLCVTKRIPLYFSLEEYAAHALGPTGKVLDDDPVLIVVMEFTKKLFDSSMTPDEWFFPKGHEVKSIYRVKAHQLVDALEKHFGVQVDPKAQIGLKTPRKLAAYFKKHQKKD